MENSAFIRSNPNGGRASSGASGQSAGTGQVPASRPLLTGTLRTAAVPPERVTAAPVTSTQTTQPRNLASAFAQAEGRRAAGETISAAVAPLPTQDLTDAFAQAEAQRVATETASTAAAALPLQDLTNAFAQAEAQRTASPAPRGGSQNGSEDVPDQDALDAALQRGIGWGKNAGGTLTLTCAASMLLDWGEDNAAARLELEPLTETIRAWLETRECCGEQSFRENWPDIAAFGDRMVVDVAPHAGRLYDAGSPNRRAHYSPVNWAAVKEAVEQAVNGAVA